MNKIKINGIKRENSKSNMIGPGWTNIAFAHPCGDQLSGCFMAYICININKWIYDINYGTLKLQFRRIITTMRWITYIKWNHITYYINYITYSLSFLIELFSKITRRIKFQLKKNVNFQLTTFEF